MGQPPPYRESCSQSHRVGIWRGWMMQKQPLYSLPITLQTEGLIPQPPWGIVFTPQSIPHGEHDGHVQGFIPFIFHIPHKDSYRQAAVLGAEDQTQMVPAYPFWPQSPGSVLGTDDLTQIPGNILCLPLASPHIAWQAVCQETEDQLGSGPGKPV